jgi:hypothetical protein
VEFDPFERGLICAGGVIHDFIEDHGAIGKGAERGKGSNEEEQTRALCD